VKMNPSVRIEANGYTDSVGTQEKNLILSTKRAKTVVDYLISQGVPKDQVVQVQGFGKTAPLDPNDPAKNRRVEVRIVGKQD
jgi:OOP family OmpA-OmpF porin